MPLELATPLSYEREPEMDPKVRVEAAEAIYLIALQVYFLVRFLWHTYCLLCVRFSRRNHIGTGCFHTGLWWVSACWKPHHPLHSSRFSWLLNLWGGFQEGGRRALWAVNGPRILQVGYEDEEDPKVMEAYERVGALVISCTHLLQSFLYSSSLIAELCLLSGCQQLFLTPACL
jgi:hypothetical protein